MAGLTRNEKQIADYYKIEEKLKAKKMLKPKTEAEKRAQAKYDKEHKEQFKSYHFKYGLTDPDNQKIVEKLANVPNKQDYIRNLILDDIAKNGY